PDSGDQLAAGSTLSIGGIDISSSQSAANSALPKIRAALEKVSEQRSLFGATQNRLEHTINNLQVAAENLSAAESRIRDVDMAAEMANFTRNQILLQAGTAMLAQAGQHRSAVGAAALGLTQREEKEKDWGQPSGWPLFFVRALRG